jgi:sugar lactone lactonase YvrE
MVARPVHAVWVAALLLLAGCSDNPLARQSKSEHGLPYRLILGPQADGYVSTMAWPRAGVIFVGYVPADPAKLPEVRRLNADGSDFRSVSLPDDPACRRTSYQGLGALHDGRLAIVKICDLPAGASPSAGYGAVAYDPSSGAVEQLFPVETRMRPSGLGFNPNDDRPVISQGGSICGTIAYLTRNGVEPIPATITDGERHWRLDDYFKRHTGDDCSAIGRADGPDWSPDGRQIAFLGFPEAIGVSGPARLEVPGNIYLMDAATLSVRSLVQNLRYPAGVSWSPDGHWLAFSASDVPGQGRGTWLVSVSTGKFVRVSDRTMTGVEWSPDGRQIIGLWDNGKGDWPPQTELEVFDVHSTTMTAFSRLPQAVE